MNRPYARLSLFRENPAFISADALGASPARHTLAKELSPSFVLISTAQPPEQISCAPSPALLPRVLTLLFPVS
jgi:hypothetical protein